MAADAIGPGAALEGPGRAAGGRRGDRPDRGRDGRARRRRPWRRRPSTRCGEASGSPDLRRCRRDPRGRRVDARRDRRAAVAGAHRRASHADTAPGGGAERGAGAAGRPRAVAVGAGRARGRLDVGRPLPRRPGGTGPVGRRAAWRDVTRDRRDARGDGVARRRVRGARAQAGDRPGSRLRSRRLPRPRSARRPPAGAGASGRAQSQPRANRRGRGRRRRAVSGCRPRTPTSAWQR